MIDRYSYCTGASVDLVTGLYNLAIPGQVIPSCESDVETTIFISAVVIRG